MNISGGNEMTHIASLEESSDNLSIIHYRGTHRENIIYF
jgi:hypothetical protein